MPAKSEKQRRLLHAKFGHAWVKKHHFNTVKPKKKSTRKKKRK